MISYDDHGVILIQVLERRVFHIKIVLTAASYSSEKRIVVENDRAAPAKQLDNGERRRLAQVVDVLLISHAEYQHPGALERLFVVIEGSNRLVHYEVGHGEVDLASQFNKPSVKVVLLCFPG